jgi:hypothetical protein
MPVLGYFLSTPERVPCMILQALQYLLCSVRVLLAMGNAVCWNTTALLADPTKYTCLVLRLYGVHNTLLWGKGWLICFSWPPLASLEINRDQGRRRRFRTRRSATHQSPTLCWPRKRAELGKPSTVLVLF